MKARCVPTAGRQVESQRVKLDQVGRSAGVHVPQLVPKCKCAKSKGFRVSMCGSALLHGTRGQG